MKKLQMLDQSFSAENFRIVFDIENRKGIYLERENKYFDGDIFKTVEEKSVAIADKKKEILKLKKLARKKNIPYQDINNKINEKKNDIKELEKEKEDILMNKLISIEKRVNKDDYDIEIIKHPQLYYGKNLYSISKTPEDFFIMKLIQYFTQKTFKVKQANRNRIIAQLKLLLGDGFPKIVVRTDIKSFYESIPHDKLIPMIDNNSLLSYPVKKGIKSILKQYRMTSNNGNLSRKGIPRGIGISAYLAEIYMRGIDRELKSLPYVSFYARYVDDIIMIFTPMNKNENKLATSYVDSIKEIIENDKYQLSINTSKTKPFDFRNPDIQIAETITYLGYKFLLGYEWKNNKKPSEGTKLTSFEVRMSDNKLEKYEKKLRKAFSIYKWQRNIYTTEQNGISNLLACRIEYLTSNTQLHGNKKNVFVGVKNSNLFLTDTYEDLKQLDKILKDEINQLGQIPPSLYQRLTKCSFCRGFCESKFKTGRNIKYSKLLKNW